MSNLEHLSIDQLSREYSLLAESYQQLSQTDDSQLKIHIIRDKMNDIMSQLSNRNEYNDIPDEGRRVYRKI